MCESLAWQSSLPERNTYGIYDKKIKDDLIEILKYVAKQGLQYINKSLHHFFYASASKCTTRLQVLKKGLEMCFYLSLNNKSTMMQLGIEGLP